MRVSPLRLLPIFFTWCLFFPIKSICYAQDTLLEWLLEHSAELSDQTSALDFLEDLSTNPVAINSVTLSELLLVPGITPEQAGRIIAHRKEIGAYPDLETVQHTGNIPQDWFRFIAQFFTLAGKDKRMKLDIRQRYQRKLEKSRGFTTGSYRGSPIKNYTRVRLDLPDTFTLGVLIEKDPGEKSLNDHSIGYIQYRSRNNSINAIAGYYSLDFAQGLLFSRKSFFTKSQEPTYPLTRRELSGRGYFSSSESEGFLGLYGKYSTKSMSVTVFTAQTERDASITDDGEVKTILESGYHRTQTERLNRNRLAETVHGFRLRLFPGNSFSIGMTGAAIRYDPGITAEKPDMTLYRFSGRELQIAGVDFTVTKNNVEIFGDFGFSNPGSGGFVGGILWGDQGTKAGLLYRNYARNFYSPFGNSFADRTSELRNERGLYLGLKQKLHSTTNLSLYIDIFEHPWRSFSNPVKENGREYFAQIHVRLNRYTSFYVNWKRRIGVTKNTFPDDYNILRTFFEDDINDRLRIQGDFQVSRNLRFNSRFEIQAQNRESAHKNFLNALTDDSGILWSAKTVYDFSPNVRCAVNTTLFSTNTTRFYQYEPDLPGLLTIKQFTDDGERFSILLSRSWKYVKLSIKYGIVHFPEKETVGSGHAAIAKNRVQDFGIQWDMTFR